MKNDFKLILTVALKQELPKDWLLSHSVPVLSLSSLRSGALSQVQRGHKGILVLLTGTGPQAGEESARWILENLKPVSVLNTGSCGLMNNRLPLGEWILPGSVSNEKGERLELDTRLPIPYPDNMHVTRSLISVREPAFQGENKSLKGHDAVDMECFAQAQVFENTGISFHCLKFPTDYSDKNMLADFNKNLDLLVQNIKNLLQFIQIKKDSIRISVIVPVYNREHTIRPAIDSILSQSSMPDEIIVVNDCSTDNTAGILESYKDSITRISLESNSGPSKARNIGIQNAHCEWIAFMDSDDRWEKNKLKDQKEFLEKYPFFEAIQSDEKWIRNGQRVNPRSHHKKPEGWIWEQSLERCLVSPSSVLIKKSLLERYGRFDETLPVCEDYDLWLKVARFHAVGLETGLSVVKYGGHKDQLSRKFSAMDRFRVTSLVRMLKNEKSQSFRMKIIPVLSNKLKILINGYEKRKKQKDARECREILNSLET
jgi:glycosyltransferase involved in cell wall biosynthesis/nucleoside phosphorylase